MKKNCDGCKALEEEQYSSRCKLGFKRKNHEIDMGRPDGGVYKLVVKVPAEVCPKPRSYKAYIDLANR